MNSVRKAVQLEGLLTIDQASKAKGATYPSLYKWIRRNNIPLVKMGNMYLVRMEDLMEYHPR